MLRRISVVMTRQLALGLIVTSPVISPTSPNSCCSSLYFWLLRAFSGDVYITRCLSLRCIQWRNTCQEVYRAVMISRTNERPQTEGGKGRCPSARPMHAPVVSSSKVRVDRSSPGTPPHGSPGMQHQVCTWNMFPRRHPPQGHGKRILGHNSLASRRVGSDEHVVASFEDVHSSLLEGIQFEGILPRRRL